MSTAGLAASSAHVPQAHERALRDLQRIRLKVFVEAPQDLDVTPLITIFSRWRTDLDHPAGWIDLADYAHVPDGPLALLVGKWGNLGYDLEDGRSALVWKNKAGLAGGVEERVVTVLKRGLELVAELAAEPDFPSDVTIDSGHIAIDVVDRVLAPNDAVTHTQLGSVLEAAIDRLYGAGRYRLERQADPGRAYGVVARTEPSPTLDQLRERLVTEPAPAKPQGEPENVGPRRVSAGQAARLIAEQGYAYLDVRSLHEFEAGHPTGAYNIPILIESPYGYGLVPNTEFVDVARATFPTDAPIVVGCRSGGRSLRALEMLESMGFTDVVDNRSGYEGGRGPDGSIEPGWSRAELPVSTEPKTGRSYAELRAATVREEEKS